MNATGRATAINKIRAVFEAKVDYSGRMAGEIFEEARNAVVRSMRSDADAAASLTFQQFNAGYMHGVTPETRFEVADSRLVTPADGEGE